MSNENNIVTENDFYFCGRPDNRLFNEAYDYIQHNPEIPKKIKSKLFLTSIELINNFICHAEKNADSSFRINQQNNNYILETSNPCSELNYRIIESKLLTLRRLDNIDDHIQDLLKQSNESDSVQLGMAFLFDKSLNNCSVTREIINDILFVKFKIIVNATS